MTLLNIIQYYNTVTYHKIYTTQLHTSAPRPPGEINDVEDKVLIAGGSRGGNKFNNFMSKRAHASQVRLDLKLIADLGLVGLVCLGY